MTRNAGPQLEQWLALTSLAFKYPHTPDVGPAVLARIHRPHGQSKRWLLQAAVLFAVVIAAIIAAVPQARALVAGWFRIGVIQIEPQGEFAVTATPLLHALTAAPGEDLPPSLTGLTGITTLAEAEKRRGAPIALPTYPPDLGAPDIVVFQPEIDLLVLVWRSVEERSRTSLALFEFMGDDPMARKVEPTILEETTVHSSPALWVEGPYPLQVSNGGYDWRRIVAGRTLLWERDGVTYRLEADLSLDEARRIAESIR